MCVFLPAIDPAALRAALLRAPLPPRSPRPPAPHLSARVRRPVVVACVSCGGGAALHAGRVPALAVALECAVGDRVCAPCVSSGCTD